MPYDIPPPKKLPKPGYYYHFKHDPSGPLNNYAYYIYGVGHHTEDNCPEADAFMQVYRPLYEELVRIPQWWSIRSAAAPDVLRTGNQRWPAGRALHEDY